MKKEVSIGSILMANFDVFISSIMADGNDGKAFERFCKHFLETSPIPKSI